MTTQLEWPRILYHKRMAPGGWCFDSQAELAGAGPGWTEAPAPSKNVRKLDPSPVEAQPSTPLPHQKPEALSAPVTGPSAPKKHGRKPKVQGGTDA